MAKKKKILPKKTNETKSFKPFPNYEGSGFETFLELLNRNQIAEFECDDFRIQLGSVPNVAPLSTMSSSGAILNSPSALPTPATSSAGSGGTTRPNNHKLIRSPFVGTFYTSPAPGKPSYVQIGAKVKPGDTLCIVEAMKLMNEIESEFQGKVIEIVAQNGRPVEFDEPLLVIEIS